MGISSKKKSIAIFQSDLQVGGIQKSLINLLGVIDYQKYRVDLYLVNKNNFFGAKLPSEVNIKTMDNNSFVQRLMPFNIARIVLERKYINLARLKYDISIDFNGYQQATALSSLAVDASKKIIWVHGNFKERLKTDLAFRFNWLLQEVKYSKFDHVVVVSEGLVDSMQELINKDVIVVNNVLDSKEIIAKSALDTPATDSEKYNLISVGRLTKDKNVKETLHVFKDALRYRRDLHLYIMGDGSERASLEQIVIDLNLDDKVTFLGSQPNPYAYMKVMDGFISTSKHEGQGISILEAKCLGLDIFIPKHLETYTYNVKGEDRMAEAISRASKSSLKKLDLLGGYNQDAVESFYRLVN
jgi:glycosyltransferase involved in cell wall biosynthesis